MKETQLEELKKQLVQWEGKLRQQQQLYEAVRSDRNHYSKGKIIWRDFFYFILDENWILFIFFLEEYFRDSQSQHES